MRAIVEEFDGYIDENDFDDKGFEPIIKTADGTIKPVIRVTSRKFMISLVELSLLKIIFNIGLIGCFCKGSIGQL